MSLENVKQFITFKVGGNEYGLDVLNIQEIVEMVAITPTVSGSSTAYEGIINLRGEIIPVIDLRKKFNAGNYDYTAETKIIILRINENKTGIIIDAVSGVESVPLKVLQSNPAVSSKEKSAYIKNVAKFGTKLLSIIDIEQVVAR